MRPVSLCLAILLCAALNAQQICFTYDAAGNRILRNDCTYVTMGIENITRNELDLPDIDLKKAMESNSFPVAPPALGVVAPNPNSGHFELTLANLSDEQGLTVELYAPTGMLLLRKRVEGTVTPFHLDGVPSGEYYLFLRCPSGFSASWKVVKR